MFTCRLQPSLSSACFYAFWSHSLEMKMQSKFRSWSWGNCRGNLDSSTDEQELFRGNMRLDHIRTCTNNEFKYVLSIYIKTWMHSSWWNDHGNRRKRWVSSIITVQHMSNFESGTNQLSLHIFHQILCVPYTGMPREIRILPYSTIQVKLSKQRDATEYLLRSCPAREHR